MQIYNKPVFILLFCLMAFPMLMWAQPKDNNPLTIFGIGDLVAQDLVPSRSMGGIGAVYVDPHQPNYLNPATLAYLESTSLNIGLHVKRATIEKNEIDESIWSGNIDAFSISFPVINPINEILERRESNFGWGMNITLRPNSRVGYHVESVEQIDSVGRANYNFQGNGGTYVFSLGNGFTYKKLSFGFTLGYLFGQSEYNTETEFPDLVNDYTHIRSLEQAYSGFVWNVGLLYKIPVDKTRKDEEVRKTRFVNIGLYYNGQQNFTSKADLLDYVINPLYNDSDTAIYVVGDESKGVLPSEIGFGVMYEEVSKMKLGVNFSASPWSNYENPLRPESLKDSWRLGFGGGYTPDHSSITSFLDRVEYRLGFHYATDPRVLEGEQGFEYGITVGAGLPFLLPRQFSFVNFGLEYGRRGMKTALKENYFRINLGLSFNDNQWFIKRRYN